MRTIGENDMKQTTTDYVQTKTKQNSVQQHINKKINKKYTNKLD